MKYQYQIKEVSKATALEMVKKYHYSNALPSINKHFIGFFLNNEIVGLVTLGWGTRPLHTIAKLFPSLKANDYYEIGRMVMTEEMPKNSESQMLSQLVKWIKKNLPDIKVLFTWADGMLGKCGYVYQASNFLYAGNIVTDFYLKDGIKIHPRQTKKIFAVDENDKRVTLRPTLEQMNQYNIKHYKGNQYRYIMFLCSKNEQKKLETECTVKLNRNYPKEESLMWKVQNTVGKWENCGMPPYKTDFCKSNHIEIDCNKENNQMSLFETG